MTRKPVIVAALMILLAVSVNGLYDPNNTHNNTGDGDMAITTHSGSSASSSGSGSARGTEGTNGSDTLWEAHISMTNRSQNLSQTGTITDISFHDTTGDKQEVLFTGYMQVPTPCHVIDHEVEEDADGYVFTVKTHEPDSDHMCAQVVTTVEYNASFEAGAPYTVTVKHGDQTVDTLTSPEQEPGPEQPEQRGSVFSGLLNWLRSLF